jgi:hypothetical protein
LEGHDTSPGQSVPQGQQLYMLAIFLRAYTLSGDSDSAGTARAHWAMAGLRPAGMSRQGECNRERTISHRGPASGFICTASLPGTAVHAPRQRSTLFKKKRSPSQCPAETRALSVDMGCFRSIAGKTRCLHVVSVNRFSASRFSTAVVDTSKRHPIHGVRNGQSSRVWR